MSEPHRDISAVAALEDPSRQGLYAFIRRARRPVTRDEAANAIGISRKLAAFHLDKLVTAGLLSARYEAAAGIPKVGRRPKVYLLADTTVSVTIPPRHLDLLADLLLDSVTTQAEAETSHQAVLRVAAERGRFLGAAERARHRPGRLGVERSITMAQGLLAGFGFEPSRESPDLLRLRNCPFHPLAAKAPETVCGINQALLAGVLDGLGAVPVAAVLAPTPGECCVQLTARH